MLIVIGLALGLIIAGLLILYLSRGGAGVGSGQPGALLAAVLYWVATIAIVAGVVLFVAPVIVWMSAQIRSALGV